MRNFLFFIDDVEITLKLKNSWDEEDSNADHRTTKRESYPPIKPAMSLCQILEFFY